MNNNPAKVIKLKQIISILSKRWRYFLVTFLIVLIAGLAYTFTSEPVYAAERSIELVRVDKQYSGLLSEFFPESSKDLWLYEGEDAKVTEKEIVDYIGEVIGTSSFLREIKNHLNFNIDEAELAESIHYYSRRNNVINIKIINSDREEVNLILQETVNLLQDYIRDELVIAYDGLITEINEKMEILSTEESNNLSVDLVYVREDLKDSKDLLINRIKISSSYDIYSYDNQLRGVTLSVAFGIFVGLLVSFSGFYFSLLKLN